MAEVDAEVLERVARWCAEAGRQAGAEEIRAALAPLSWDEMLRARALLVDPPPARPLGPHALADLARGTPADVAAEREREGRYLTEGDREHPGAPAAPAVAPSGGAGAPRRKPRRGRAASVVVRRARDRAPEAPPSTPSLPLLEELGLPGGRAVLERLVRRLGARRAALTAELATGWRRADGRPPTEDDLAALLDLHGIAHAFERRERDELLHALRAAGGVRARAGARVGLEPGALEAALSRLGASAEAERIREERRAELRGRATLTERVHLLLGDPDRLADLGLLDEIEGDLRTRLPEHVRALRAAGGSLRAALGASLSLAPDAALALAARFGLELPEEARAAGGPGGARRFREVPGGRRSGGRVEGSRGDRPRTDRPRADRARPDRPRGDRPRTDRPRGERPRGERPGADRPRGERPRPDARSRPAGAGPGPRAAPRRGEPPGRGRPGAGVAGRERPEPSRQRPLGPRRPAAGGGRPRDPARPRPGRPSTPPGRPRGR